MALKSNIYSLNDGTHTLYTSIWCSLYPEQEIYRFRNLFNFVYGINSYGRRSARDLSRYLLCYNKKFSLVQNGPVPFKVINIKFKQQDRISKATFMTFKNASKICCHNFGNMMCLVYKIWGAILGSAKQYPSHIVSSLWGVT